MTAARNKAWRHDANVEYALERDVPLFNRSFAKVAQEFLTEQEKRAEHGEVSAQRPKKLRAVIEGPLNDYMGSTQVHLIGDETWKGYTAWRRTNGEGRAARNGVRPVSEALATKLADQELAMREKGRAARGLRARPLPGATNRRGVTASKEAIEAREAAIAERMKGTRQISDSTIRFELSVFASVMGFAMKKRYAPVSQRYENRPKLKVMRRDEFTHEEYTQLYSYSRNYWVKGKEKPKSEDQGKEDKPTRKLSPVSHWYRTVTHNFVLVMCNTGMRPGEAKNLRWKDVSAAKDRDGNEIVVLAVQGKGKSRKLVAVPSVGKYLDRIRACAREAARKRAEAEGKKNVPDHAIEPRPDDPVFTTIDGTPASSLYKHLIDDLLTKAELRDGPGGTVRSTYSFRHTYATMRLSEGVDVYLLAEQMGTSVKMIEDHYGHVNSIRHADRLLQGAGGWTSGKPDDVELETKAKATKAAATRDKVKRPATPQRGRRPRVG
ncbi:site-specific integrase [Sphingobium sp. MK2]|uniref:tyrosine-type recombinase/integrase n=1 Tax=Sphingobium sp. MK2 TaxID=3116540 RepID=UPI0032E35FF1